METCGVAKVKSEGARKRFIAELHAKRNLEQLKARGEHWIKKVHRIGKANIATRRVEIAAANIIRKSGWEHLIPQQADTQNVQKKGHGDRSLASCITLIRNRNTLYIHDDGSCM